MKQMARNLLDAYDGFLREKRYLILDRDPLYTKEFRQMLRGAGLKPLLLPARSPNLNAYAERFVLSIKSECLDRIVPLGERHLRRDPAGILESSGPPRFRGTSAGVVCGGIEGGLGHAGRHQTTTQERELSGQLSGGFQHRREQVPPVVAIKYTARMLFIRFIGSHAQYDRIDVEAV